MAGTERLCRLLQVEAFWGEVTESPSIHMARYGRATLVGETAVIVSHPQTETEAFRASRNRARRSPSLMATRAALSGQWEWPQMRTEISGSLVTAPTAFMCSGAGIRTNPSASNNMKEASRLTCGSPPTVRLGPLTAADLTANITGALRDTHKYMGDCHSNSST